MRRRPRAATFLVGPNGSGKSNFVDALRFVTDALNQSLDHAIRDRGGINEVRRRSSGHPRNFSIRLDFANAHLTGRYAFGISAGDNGAWSVDREECHVLPLADVFAHPDGLRFETQGGEVAAFPQHLGVPPPAAADRLYLVNAAGHAPFRMVLDALSRMGFYNLDPDAMRELQPPDPGHLLKRDGSNVASALARIEADPKRKQRLLDYLERVVPGVIDVEHSRRPANRARTMPSWCSSMPIRTARHGSDRRVTVVLAKAEFEAWLPKRSRMPRVGCRGRWVAAAPRRWTSRRWPRCSISRRRSSARRSPSCAGTSRR